MNPLIRSLVDFESNQNDIVVHGHSKSVHVRRLSSLLQRFCELDIVINPPKFVSSSSSVHFPGILSDKKGLSPIPIDYLLLGSCRSPHEFRKITRQTWFSGFSPVGFRAGEVHLRRNLPLHNNKCQQLQTVDKPTSNDNKI